MHQAILLSKLAYEEELVIAAKTEKEQEQSKKSGKKSKKATMSLEEFNSILTKHKAPHSTGTNATPVVVLTTDPVENKSKGMVQVNSVHMETLMSCFLNACIVSLMSITTLAEVDAEFFDRVEKETKEEITKGKEKDMLKARLNKMDDDITSVQLKVEIEKRDEIIGQLRTEVHTLKEELTQVKERNKKLYQILSHGESEYRWAQGRAL